MSCIKFLAQFDLLLGGLLGDGQWLERRHGVSVQAVLTWRNKFLDAGQQALGDKIPGPGKSAGSADERRLKLENNQLKLALAEATVQLRIWQKGAEYVESVPSQTSRP
jgi:transposase